MDIITDESKVYLINWFKYYDINNLKLSKLFKLILDDDRCVVVDNVSTKDITDFIKANKDREYKLFFPIYSQDFKNASKKSKWVDVVGSDLVGFLNEQIEVAKVLTSLEKVSLKVVFCIRDIYFGLHNRTVLNKLLYRFPNNHIIALPLISLDSFVSYIKTIGVNPRLTTRCVLFNTFHCYHIADFKDNPKNTICVSGKINRSYPERVSVLKYPGVEKLEYNWNYRLNNDTSGYINTLSNHIACFVSNYRTPHIDSPVLKFFEILASGSLLVCSKRDSNICKKMGLVHKENCFVIDQANIGKSINEILSPKNREQIDLIRKEGYKLAIEKFNPQNKYLEFSSLLDKLLS